MRGQPGDVDVLYSELQRIGERRAELQRCLESQELEDDAIRALLRRAVPVRLLEILASQPPWSERPRVLAAVVLHSKTPRALALRLVEGLFWRDQAEVAATPRLNLAVRSRAEALLLERVPRLGLGSRLSLAHVATGAVLMALLHDGDRRVIRAALQAARLTERDLVRALRARPLVRQLVDEVVASTRWSGSYAARLEIARHPQTPLALSLAQLTSLRPRDLRDLTASADLPLLVQAAAARVLRRRS